MTQAFKSGSVSLSPPLKGEETVGDKLTLVSDGRQETVGDSRRQRLAVVIPELTALRGYPSSEAHQLLTEVLALPANVQADLAAHFQTELAAWRRACGQPELFS